MDVNAFWAVVGLLVLQNAGQLIKTIIGIFIDVSMVKKHETDLRYLFDKVREVTEENSEIKNELSKLKERGYQ